MPKIKTITLDLDDTLWPVRPVILRAEQRLLEWYRQHYPNIPALFDQQRTLDLRARIAQQHSQRAYDLSFLRREVISSMATEAGYADFDVEAAFAVFDAARNDVELFSDVKPALRALRERYTLIAVTNGNACLERIGIRDLFDHCLTARELQVAKPDKRIFAAAVAMGGASAAETLHIGDHPEMDVDGARAAGLVAVWLNREGLTWPETLRQPAKTVTNLHELDSLLLAEAESLS